MKLQRGVTMMHAAAAAADKTSQADMGRPRRSHRRRKEMNVDADRGPAEVEQTTSTPAAVNHVQTADQPTTSLLALIKSGDRWRAAATLKAASKDGTAPGPSGTHCGSRRPTRLNERVDLEEQDDRKDGTPLICAAARGYEELVSLLLAVGADANAKATGNCVTAIHVAAERGRTDILRQLLCAGADVNALTLLGETACHLAAYHGHPDSLRTLLEFGADWTRRNWRGNDALEEAATGDSRRCGQCVRILREVDEVVFVVEPSSLAVSTKTPVENSSY